MKKDLTEADVSTMLVEELRRTGYCIIRNEAIARVHALAKDLDPIFEATPFCDGNFYGRRTKRFGSLLKRSEHMAALVLNPIILPARSEEHKSELQSLMRISYAVFCLKKKNKNIIKTLYI